MKLNVSAKYAFCSTVLDDFCSLLFPRLTTGLLRSITCPRSSPLLWFSSNKSKLECFILGIGGSQRHWQHRRQTTDSWRRFTHPGNTNDCKWYIALFPIQWVFSFTLTWKLSKWQEVENICIYYFTILHCSTTVISVAMFWLQFLHREGSNIVCQNIRKHKVSKSSSGRADSSAVPSYVGLCCAVLYHAVPCYAGMAWALALASVVLRLKRTRSPLGHYLTNDWRK